MLSLSSSGLFEYQRPASADGRIFIFCPVDKSVEFAGKTVDKSAVLVGNSCGDVDNFWESVDKSGCEVELEIACELHETVSNAIKIAGMNLFTISNPG